MQISSRFTIAIHMLVAIDNFQEQFKITSDFLSSSIQVNPVIVRRTMQQLKAAGIISVARGSGGMTILRPYDEITLLDIFNAVESLEEGKLFHFHENPNANCPVGRNIHAGLDDKLQAVQDTMEAKLREFTLADVINDTQKQIQAGL